MNKLPAIQEEMQMQNMSKVVELLNKEQNGIPLTEAEKRTMRDFRNDADRSLRERFPNGPDGAVPLGSHTF